MVGRMLPARKPTLAAVWRKIGRATLAYSGEEVGCVSHVLREVKLTYVSPGKRAATFNRILEKAGVADRVQQHHMENHHGQLPYVARTETFMVSIKHV
jgi:hypothetical protein